VISVIIPTYNEAGIISKTIQVIKDFDRVKSVTEIIVSDGGSTDGTINEAVLAGAKVISSTKGRAVQMNAGAAITNNSFLYFLHADTIPPVDYTSYIVKAVRKGYTIGCFRLKFDVDHWF
jgi:glycosyltransferase involved in cell wall biosynthesis